MVIAMVMMMMMTLVVHWRQIIIPVASSGGNSDGRLFTKFPCALVTTSISGGSRCSIGCTCYMCISIYIYIYISAACVCVVIYVFICQTPSFAGGKIFVSRLKVKLINRKLNHLRRNEIFIYKHSARCSKQRCKSHLMCLFISLASLAPAMPELS